MGTLRRAKVTLLTMELTLHNNLIIQVITTTAILGAVRSVTAMVGAATTIIITIMLGVVIHPMATAVLGMAMATMTTILGAAVMVITTMQRGATAATVRGAAVTTITRAAHLLKIAMLPATAAVP
jgi:hypothetical protein